jgi:glycosyltransferase involved in cell wall biosynthesis
MEGISVIRLPVWGLPHRGLLNRFIIYGWYAMLSILGLRACRGSQRIISLGPHPFAELPAYIAKIATRSLFVVDISDLWPETWRLKNSVANALFQGAGFCLNTILLRHLCDRLSVYNERALELILRRYRFNKQHVIIYNSVNTNAFVYQPKLKAKKEKLQVILQRDLRDVFVVLYHGVIGPYQRLDNIVKAASIEEDELKRVLFIIVGDGEEKKKVIEYAESVKNRNTIFLPRVPREQIIGLVAESDLGLVPIVSSDYLTRFVSMPLKATEFLACGTPVLVPKGSFIGKIVTECGAGFEVDFADPLNVFDVIKEVVSDNRTYRLMAREARQVAVDRFSLDVIGEAIQSIMT